MVERDGVPRRGECVARRFGVGVGRGVDDPRAAELGRRHLQLSLFLGSRAHAARRKLELRAVEIPGHDLGIA